MALDAWDLLAEPIWGLDAAPPFDFLFSLLGIEERDLALEVYRRLCLMHKILREHREAEQHEQARGEP